MTKEELIRYGKDYLHDLETACCSISDIHKEFVGEAIKALETVEEFEKAQIITGGRLNGRTYAYKCGLEDGKRKALEQQPSDDCVSIAELEKWLDLNFSFGGACRKLELFDKLEKELTRVTPTQSWIPVSERLPEEGKEVLVYYKYFRYGDYNCMYPTYSVGFQYDGIWGGDVRGHKLNVIAWQPLPKPYEEKRGVLNDSN